MEELDMITALIVAIIPAGTSILGVLSVAAALVHKFKDVIALVKDIKKDADANKEQLEQIMQENAELKRTNRKLMLMSCHVKETDDNEIGSD